MRVGSLFAGIGGFDLAARNVGWSTVWYSEIDPYACRVMHKHFPDAVNLGDITTITNPPAVDVLCGGFPCQDISYAGDGAGIAVGTRSGLWYEYARLIAEVRPHWVVAENVAALRTRGLDTVLCDLDALGYVGEWHCIPASAVGAPHQRDRLWIVANARSQQHEGAGHAKRRATAARLLEAVADTAGDGRGQGDANDRGGSAGAGPRQERRSRRSGPHVANTDSQHGRERGSEGERGRQRDGHQARHGGAPVPDTVRSRLEGQRDIASRVGAELDHARHARWWATEPDVGRVAHGVPARVDRIRCLGNAIVPQVAEVLFRAIQDAETERAGVAAQLPLDSA